MFVKENAQNCWVGNTQAPQGQETQRKKLLCVIPSTFKMVSRTSATPYLPAEDLEVLFTKGMLTRSVSFCAGLEEADVNVGVKNPFHSSCRLGEREALNGSSSTGLKA